MSQDRNLELSDLLSNLRQEGDVVSTESDFTLHSSKAKEKLKEYQLSNPYFFILKLVQSAVLAGASEVKVECLPHQVSLEHDGAPPKREQLKELLNYLFLQEEELETGRRSLKRLASGVNTAVATHAKQLFVRCFEDGSAYQQSWSSQGIEFEELGESDKVGVYFALRRKASDVASSLRHVGDTRLVDLAKGNRNTVQKEEAALWDRCIYAPITVRVNGEKINRDGFGTPKYPGYNPGSNGKVPLLEWLKNRDAYLNRDCHKRYHLIQAYHAAPPESTTGLPAPSKAHSFQFSPKPPHQPGKLCSFMIGLESGLSLPNRVNFIKEGVLIQQLSPKLPAQGVEALVSADGLRTDLSGFRLLEGEVEPIMQAFTKAARELIDECHQSKGLRKLVR